MPSSRTRRVARRRFEVPAVVVLRGVAWPAFGSMTIAGAGVGLAGVLVASVRLTLLMVAGALLATGAAFLLDDSAGAVTDVTPGHRRHMWVRARLLAVPLGLGGLLSLVSPSAVGGARLVLVVALTGGPLLAFTIARILRASSNEPGGAAAMVAAGVLIVPGMLGRFGLVQTFPGVGRVDPPVSPAWWWVVSDLACATVLVLAPAVSRSGPRALPRCP